MKSFIEFQKEEVELDEAFIAPALSASNANAEFARKPNTILKVDIKHVGGSKDHKSIESHLASKGIKAVVGTTGDNLVHLSGLSHSHSEVRKKLGIKEEVELEEATVKTQKYSWGTMKTVHQGSDFSIPLHPEHHQEIAKLKDQQEHKFKDETGRHWTAKRSGDDVHFKGANGGNSTTVKHSTMSEEVELDEDTKYTPRFEYRQKVQPNIDKHLDDRKTAGAHTAITYHKQSDGSTHAKVQYRNISHTNSSGVGPIQHKHFSVNKDHSVTPIKINEEQLDEARGKVVASYIQKAKEAMKKKIDMKRKTAQLNDPNSAEKKIVKESDLDEEQLDELSKDTLASYEKKSRVAAHKHALASELKGLAADPAGSYAHKMMADKRHAGWKVAVKKLNTEESDLDEESEKMAKKDPVSTASKMGRPTGFDKSEKMAKKDPVSTASKMGRPTGFDPSIFKFHKEESDTPFEGPYKQSKGTVTDKSGAKHTPLSNVRSLARNAIEKMKQKMRMAHLSPEVKAEKLARNEELVGGQKKLDIDKDGKIEKSDLEALRAKKLKEDVTTAAQKLKAALDRHTEHAVAANRAGDHDAVKVHQGYANKIKTQLGKLAKNEEVEIDEEQLDELSKDTLASYVNKSAKDVGERSHRPDHVKRLKGIRVAVKKLSGHQHRDIELPTRKGNHLNRGDSEEEDSNDPRHDARNIDPSKLTKKSDLGSYVNKAAREISGTSYRPNHAEYLQGIRTAVKKLHTEEVELDEEQIEERNKQNAIMRKTMDASRGAKFKARNDTTTPDAEPQHKTAQAHNKAIGRAIRQMSNEEVEIKEAEMTDAEMAKREKIVKGMKKSFKDFTTKYGDRAKEVMYATATKKAMEEEVEEELEEDMDEGVTTRNGAITVHKGTYGTSYQPNDDEDDEDTPEKKEPAVKRGRGRPAGAKSGAKPKGSSAGKSYGGVAIHSLRLPNNNK